jgi:hypothetical protein
MSIDKTMALAQIDAVTARRKELGQNWVPENVQEITTLCCAAIKHLAPPGSAYLEELESVLKNTVKSTSRSCDEEGEFRLQGILGALRGNYDAGRLQGFEEAAAIPSDLGPCRKNRPRSSRRTAYQSFTAGDRRRN